MLLSDDAVINTKPQLEIYADDVKCSHGSSTGQIDENALFYLRARGIGTESARALLLVAFAKDVINTIRIDALRLHVENLIEERLTK
jgi:Fe-S cluster assembly protein SufD